MPPVGAAIGAIVGGIGSAVTALGAITIGSMSLGTIAGRLLLSVAVSALSSAMAKKPKIPGIRTDNTLTGGTQADSWIIGRFATAGVAVCPAMTYGVPGTLGGSGTQNEFRVLVIDVSGIAGGPGLLRLYVNDEVVELGTEEDILPGWSEPGPPEGGFLGMGWPPGGGSEGPAEVEPAVSRGVKALGKHAGFLSVIWRDGTDTEADPYLLRVFGQYPDRPWTADMIGRGRQIAILTFKLNRELFPSSPKVAFEVAGIPMYDPRLDGSVGGSGPQRWSDPSTWAVSHNTAVQAYNILRGISVGPEVWGGGVTAEALPLPVFTAAMDRADAAVELAGGGNEPRFRTGTEVLAADEPASILEDLLTSANGTVAEVGGEWRIRLGEPDGPVHFFEDGDIVISKPQDLDPFPGLDQTHNAVTGTWPDPDSLWEAREAPPIQNPVWEEADGDLVWDEGLSEWIRRPRRLTAALTLNACPYGHQVQRVMRAYIQDERRFGSHLITLGPEAAHVEPLDVISWTSARNGYDAKLFEVQEVAHDLMSGQVSLSIREVDSADYDWTPALEQPMPAPPVAPAESPLLRPMTESGSYAGPFFEGAALLDAEGDARRPVILASWSPALAALAVGMEWEIRLAGETEVILHGSIQAVVAGRAEISAGILPGTAYEARLTPVAPALRVQASAWEAVTVPDVRLSMADLADSVADQMAETAELAGVKPVTSLPAAGDKADQIVMQVPDGILYRWDSVAAEWTRSLFAGIKPGDVGVASFAAGIEPVTVHTGGSLPGVKSTEALFWSGKLYRWNGTAYVATVPTADLTGQISGVQITDSAVSAAKIAANAVTTAKIAAGAVLADNIAANAITTGKIAAGAVSTDQLAARSVIASKLLLTDAENLVPDGTFQGQDDSLLGGAGVREFVPVTDGSGPNALRWTRPMPGTTGNDVRASTSFMVPVVAGAEYWLEARVRAVSTGSAPGITGRVIWHDAAGGVVSQSLAAANSSVGDVWELRAGRVAAPSNAVGALWSIISNATPGTPVAVDIDRIVLRRANAASLIVDGGIVANLIAAGAVTAEKVAANAIVASKIAAGSITTDKIAAGAIVADKIAAGAITAESAIIANAAVGTLQIAGQSVIIPVYNSTGAVIPNESTSEAVDIISAVINREGYRTRVSFGGQLDGIPPAVAFGKGAVGLFEVSRGATQIAGNMAHATGYRGARTSFCFVFDDTNLDPGTTTYTIRMRRLNSGEADRVPRVIAPWIELLQFKR